jgi:hypothetical protein
MNRGILAVLGWLSLFIMAPLSASCGKGSEHQNHLGQAGSETASEHQDQVAEARSEIESRFAELRELAREISRSAEAAAAAFANRAQSEQMTAMIAHEQKYNFTALVGETVIARENERNAIIGETVDKLAASKKLLEKVSLPLSRAVLEAENGPDATIAFTNQAHLDRYLQRHQELRTVLRSTMKTLRASRAYPGTERARYQSRFEEVVAAGTAAVVRFNQASATADVRAGTSSQNALRANGWGGGNPAA